MEDQKEIELHMIVNQLEDKAENAKRNFDYLNASLLKSWINQIVDGGASIKEAKQMLKASNLK